MHHLTYGQSFIVTGAAIIAVLIIMMAITIYFARRDPDYQAELLAREAQQLRANSDIGARIA